MNRADTRARIKALELDLQRQRAELALYSSDDKALTFSSSERENKLRELRSANSGRRATLTSANGKSKSTNDSGNSTNGKKARKEVPDAR